MTPYDPTTAIGRVRWLSGTTTTDPPTDDTIQAALDATDTEPEAAAWILAGMAAAAAHVATANYTDSDARTVPYALTTAARCVRELPGTAAPTTPPAAPELPAEW